MEGKWGGPLFHIGDSMNIEEKIKQLISPIIIENNYILDSVKFLKEDDVYFLRISIDKDGFIDVDDCVNVNGLINPILDEADIIQESYILDICSKEKGGN